MNCSMPYMPRFEIVKVPSSRSASWSLPSRARDDDVGAAGRDLLDRLAVGVADHRHHEAARRRDRDADVRVRQAEDLPVDEVRVHGGWRTSAEATTRVRTSRDRRLRVALAHERDEPLANREELGRVGA